MVLELLECLPCLKSLQMFRRSLLKLHKKSVLTTITSFTHDKCEIAVNNEKLITPTEQATNSYQILDTRSIPSDDFIDLARKDTSVLEKCQEDVSHVAPYLKPTFNFAAYVNKSETLQQLIHLGVNLYKLEKTSTIPPYLLKLDFEKDMKKYVMFLLDVGLSMDDLGTFITKNPLLFQIELSDLEARINYLKSKKFNSDMIVRILQRSPMWLSFR